MSKRTPDTEPAKILWTGGWDSTFRLMQLLLSEKRRVQPYYLIDEDRPSTGTELLTMKRIRARIREFSGPAADLMLSTRFFSVSAIPACSRIADAFAEIRRRRFIGRQYEWLAGFCECRGMSGLELCIHVDDKAAAVVAPWVSAAQQNGHSLLVGDTYVGTSEYALFKYFEFPILKLTKTDMARVAQERGWSHVMNMTWFCHHPLLGKPCGLCKPCRYTIEEGLAWRIPRHRRVMGSILRISVQPARELVKKALIVLGQKGRRSNEA